MSPAISKLIGIQTTAVVMFTTESLKHSVHQLATLPANSNFGLVFISQTHASTGVINIF